MLFPPRCSTVSIPFSTIKSPEESRIILEEYVSIPFSTIKSPSAPLPTPQCSWFQFHLVRLKENRDMDIDGSLLFQFHLVRLKECSSIIGLGFLQFQFHLVRLKESTDDILIKIRRKFQFHLVRLKDFVRFLSYTLLTFQFHLVRLKDIRRYRHFSAKFRFNSIQYD